MVINWDKCVYVFFNRKTQALGETSGSHGDMYECWMVLHFTNQRVGRWVYRVYRYSGRCSRLTTVYILNVMYIIYIHDVSSFPDYVLLDNRKRLTFWHFLETFLLYRIFPSCWRLLPIPFQQQSRHTCYSWGQNLTHLESNSGLVD